ncbi:HNH endonuclease [Rhizobium leguminosarum]|uniref:HNH endonuclease n=1 Tax=Rhizobium leguminosarum TaxID=384 RepID=UPI0014414F3D|nr:HNH endonuclease [Rhizobium leguminosarum]NKL78883.1 HNH endonuclease [Rhizobium leguminosarum bv. viciae]
MPNVICPCGVSVPKGTRCDCSERRAKAREKQLDAERGSAASRGYDSKWRRESQVWLAALGEPLCACGCGRKANMVDHRVAAKGDEKLFWDRKNWQPYHTICNTRKAIREEGGFGRKPKVLQ